jgi:hypothetical protein
MTYSHTWLGQYGPGPIPSMARPTQRAGGARHNSTLHGDVIGIEIGMAYLGSRFRIDIAEPLLRPSQPTLLVIDSPNLAHNSAEVANLAKVNFFDVKCHQGRHQGHIDI